MSNVSPDKDPREWPSLFAFVAVLATGAVLLLVGHLTVAALTTACAAMVGLYLAFHHRRRL